MSLFKVFPLKMMEFEASLKQDSVPFMAPLDFNPYEQKSES